MARTWVMLPSVDELREHPPCPVEHQGELGLVLSPAGGRRWRVSDRSRPGRILVRTAHGVTFVAEPGRGDPEGPLSTFSWAEAYWIGAHLPPAPPWTGLTEQELVA